MNKTTQNGYTLYELMVTVLIVGVVLSLGIPNMREYSQNSRMTTTANDFHSAFHLARSESSRAKTNITICPSVDQVTCGGTWDQGYIVFVDTDGNLATGGVNESVLRVHPEVADGVSMVVQNGASYFSFAATGRGRQNVNGLTALSRVLMCDERGHRTAAGGRATTRMFIATPMGRATILNEYGMVGQTMTDESLACP